VFGNRSAVRGGRCNAINRRFGGVVQSVGGNGDRSAAGGARGIDWWLAVLGQSIGDNGARGIDRRRAGVCNANRSIGDT
jgi:hypothetical protein